MMPNNSTEKDIDNPPIPIDKKAIIQYDGKQYFVRIPKEIEKFYDIKPKYRFRFIITPTGKGKGKNSFEIGKR